MKKFNLKFEVKWSLLVTISALLFFIISQVGSSYGNQEIEKFVFISLVILFFYGIYYTFMMLRHRSAYIHLLPFVILNWFLGCFCTNVFINIFENFPVWVYLITLIYCLSLFMIYTKVEHKYLSSVVYFFNGLSIVLILYFAIYLIPFMIFSALGILVLGIGFYGLVPLLAIVIHCITLYRVKINFISFLAGITTSIIIVFGTSYLINQEINKINQNGVTKSFDINDDLPTYIKISQHYNPNFLNEVVLKKGLVYKQTDNFFSFNDFRLFHKLQFNSRKIHNPLYNIAFFFSEKLNIGVDDQIRILQSNFDKRLETEEQLWSGKNLYTKNIKEDVQIFPETRLAYTEFTIDITSESYSEWQQEEGIYSFQLPENSVATSLSLWVNGIERKGVLTTKEKAQNAYNHIVGVEYRDPSLMQWREGNRIVVRVFPISKKLPRTFKCGFTSPLKVINQEMVYQNIAIHGPRISEAAVVTRLQIDNQQKFTSNKNFDLKNGNNISENDGLENWNVYLKINQTLKNNTFEWKNKVYETQVLNYKTIEYKPTEIILDLNKHWEEDEIKLLLNTKKKFYYIINNQKKEINYENYQQVLSLFQDLHYSLLPFYYFKEKSLIITKSNKFSANFEELKDSNYLLKIKENCKNRELKVINISTEINPFWQTMKEQYYVTFINQDLQKTIFDIQKNEITLPKTYDNAVTIEASQITIIQKDTTNSSISGDNNHIYRMYAFGKVMKEHVEQSKDSINNRYVALAQDANIVTPITSLIVLETDDDYKKQGIEKNVDGLGNASVKNEGAVPEPHEWVLIIMSLIAVWYFYFKKNNLSCN